MYSPFIDKNGKAKGIDQVQYEDLFCLKDLSEGYHIEFKGTLEESEKHNISKVVSAFSNCEGGWLFIGISDDRNITPIESFDYSQKIGKLLTRVSPMPEIETKFIELPEDKLKGVLVIYVYEGRNAPYICDGAVYVRCGSNKEPIKPADRGNVEYLIQRTREYKRELDNFFQRDYHFSLNGQISRQEIKYPFICIYLKNIRSREDNRLYSYQNRRILVDFVKKSKFNLRYAQYTMNSVLFMSDYIYPGKGGTFVFEVFYDWSCKIYCPVGISNLKELERAKDYYRDFGIPDDVLYYFRVANAGTTYDAIYAYVLCFAELAKEYRLQEKDYVMCGEIENAGNFIMSFDGLKYKEYINENGGIPYAVKNSCRSTYLYLRENQNIGFYDLPGIVLRDIVGPAFGFENEAILDLLNEHNQDRVNV